MPKFQVEKSIDINAPAPRVRDTIQDYRQWSVWSPWLCMEPSAKVDCSGLAATPGHAYCWEGELVGSGRMTLAEIDGNTDKMDLTFLKPFKSTAKVEFTTTELDAGNTRVTWCMDSGLPFFLFFMTGTMKAMIGMDYHRGLQMLKEYVETGVVTSKTEIVGIVDVPAILYAGVSADSELSNISTSMEQAFGKLTQITASNTTDEYCGAVYHSMNIKTGHCSYTAFAPVNENTATGSIATCKALKVVHTGRYQHLGNAWSTANNYQRHKKLKKNKNIHPFELYQNDPQQVAAEELITEIYLPVNS